MCALPAGVTWRRPTPADAEAIFALVAAHTRAVVGFADVTLADVVDELVEPGFDREHDGWLVYDAGRLVAWGWAMRPDEGADVAVDVISADDAAAAWTWEQVLERAAAIGAEAGHQQVNVDVGVYRDDEPGRARVMALGFSPATTFHRMRIDHVVPVEQPDVPAGVVVEVGPGDEAFRRAAHALHQASFVDHFGFSPQPFEAWHEAAESSSIHDWSQTRIARVDGEDAAFLMGNDQFAEDEACGYVRRVGVLPAHRGRGLATLLLLQAFARDCAQGRVGTLLHVDTANVTPALGLYEGLGMRPVLVIDVWRRTL